MLNNTISISMVFQYWTNWRKSDFKAWCWEEEPYSRFNNVDVYFVDVVIWCYIRTPYSRQLYAMRERLNLLEKIFYECACLSIFFSCSNVFRFMIYNAGSCVCHEDKFSGTNQRSYALCKIVGKGLFAVNVYLNRTKRL